MKLKSQEKSKLIFYSSKLAQQPGCECSHSSAHSEKKLLLQLFYFFIKETTQSPNITSLVVHYC